MPVNRRAHIIRYIRCTPCLHVQKASAFHLHYRLLDPYPFTSFSIATPKWWGYIRFAAVSVDCATICNAVADSPCVLSTWRAYIEEDEEDARIWLMSVVIWRSCFNMTPRILIESTLSCSVEISGMEWICGSGQDWLKHYECVKSFPYPVASVIRESLFYPRRSDATKLSDIRLSSSGLAII